MAQVGLIYIMDIKPSPTCRFITTKRYRYIFPRKPHIRTFIDLELYENYICVVSFFQKGMGDEKTKYKVRTGLGPGHILAVLKACIKAYIGLDENYAFVFSAANDVGIVREDNPRYNAYTKFLEHYFPDYDQYIKKGSFGLNTLMFYPEDFQYKKEADEFYKRFEEKTQENTFSAN